MKRLLRLSLALVFCFACADVAFSWGNATHTYIAAKLGQKCGHQNYNEMYGAVLPDAFNFILDANGTYVAGLTHDDPMAFVRVSWGAELKAVAFGFASHNQLWAADNTAHILALTAPDTGWVVMKEFEFTPQVRDSVLHILVAAGVPEDLALQLAYGLAPTFAHDLIETAVDILVRRELAPQVGTWMSKAASDRPRLVPLTLAAAYAKDLSQYSGMSRLDAVKFIVGAEAGHRDFCMQYGGIFTLSEEEELYALSVLNAQIGEGFLNAYLEGTPFIVDVDSVMVLHLIEAALAKAQEAPAYGPELAATLEKVKHELDKHHITSGLGPFVFHKEADPGASASTVPTVDALEQNYPNPFNPTTAISGQWTEDSDVRLAVYDAIGREVAVLANGRYPAGRYSFTFNAKGLASGIYFCRLIAGNFVATKSMLLAK